MIVILGALVFGGVDLWFTTSGMGGEEVTTSFLWTIMLHYLLLGCLVFLGGFVTFHPIFKFKIASWWRGIVLSLPVTLYTATGSLMHEIQHMGQWEVFWWIVISGAIIGMILDVCGSRWGGEGEILSQKIED